MNNSILCSYHQQSFLRMDLKRSLKDIFYGELASGKRTAGRFHLHVRDVCKRDLRTPFFFFFYINKGSTRPFLLETRATHRFSREERKNKTGDWGTVKTKEVQPKV